IVTAGGEPWCAAIWAAAPPGPAEAAPDEEPGMEQPASTSPTAAAPARGAPARLSNHVRDSSIVFLQYRSVPNRQVAPEHRAEGATGACRRRFRGLPAST